MERKFLTVSAINRYLKYKFDADINLQSILLKAEISNFKRHSRGHLYLTLKDEYSEISAVMFAGNARDLKFLPKDGDKVIVEGHVSIYEPRGSYQVYIKKMSIDGVGDLYLAYEKLKKELEIQGLFSQEHKQELPKYPKAIGVITSPTGAAIRDIINVISLRYPLTKIIVYPALVQGINAKNSIVEQIKQANSDQLVDLIICGRGGGSIEDLWAFNEEVVARAIYNSRLPIISAVGHETDFTIADFVADLRASTPSHAAEIAVPNQSDILDDLTVVNNRLALALTNNYCNKKTDLDRILTSHMLKNPEKLLDNSKLRLLYLEDKLNAYKPKKLIDSHFDRINSLDIRLNQIILNSIKNKVSDFNRIADKLELVNPLAIMKKGYTVVKQEGKIKKSVKEINTLETLTVDFYDGSLDCVIKEVK
ncbi:MAG: exodeoxyribonuclease VII large subunit [Sphaerochaetaceae bacterium]|nr:exodeoxyribonuclease VII large subunit [Sphaerochaetaceae bacterium]